MKNEQRQQAQEAPAQETGKGPQELQQREGMAFDHNGTQNAGGTPKR